MPSKKYLWLLALSVGLILVLGVVLFQASRAVVTVRFVPQEREQKLDALYVTVGAEKQHASGLNAGDSERFSFAPQPEYPVILVFAMGGRNEGWDGPALRPRLRLEVTVDEKGQVQWKECLWPCWAAEK